MKLHHWPCIAVAVLLLAAPGLARAEEDQTFGAFVSSCFQYLGEPQKLTETLDRVAQRLQGETAHQHLNGRAGKAWLMTVEDSVYGFVLTDQGTCTMTAASGDPETIAQDFVLFSELTENSYRIAQEPITREDGWDYHGLTVFDPGNPTDIHVHMAVNTAPVADRRAIISVARVRSTDPDRPARTTKKTGH